MTTTVIPAPLVAAVCAVLVAAVFGALAVEHCAGRRVAHSNDGEVPDRQLAEERAS